MSSATRAISSWIRSAWRSTTSTVTGRWRIRENGIPLDTRGQLYDGTPLTSPTDLHEAMMRLRTPVLRNFTANLMAYGLGRRVEYYDMPAVRRIVRRAEENDYRPPNSSSVSSRAMPSACAGRRNWLLKHNAEGRKRNSKTGSTPSPTGARHEVHHRNPHPAADISPRVGDRARAPPSWTA